ncbi:hypothetical protein FRB99_006714 [Tulasnella sp. 403]|nr:hypothetical protein FRB99_006714 [Tulasnella sp. 403]
MNGLAGLSRDTGRAQLPGLQMPYLELELDEPKILLSDADLRNAFRFLCGRITVAPESTTWYDGSVLTLVQLTLSITSPPRQGQNPQNDTFHELNVTDLTIPRNRRLDPMAYDTCIQFGSKIADSKGTLCPFAMRLPTKACLPGGERQFTFSAKAVFLRSGPPTPSAPAQFEINSNPMVIAVSHGR